MNEEKMPVPQERLSWTDKLLTLDTTLRDAGLPYAFGGAIALNYHRDPRSTLDIDINIFLDPSQQTAALDALQPLCGLSEREKLERSIREQGQGRASWDETFVDLFFADTDFHHSMAERVVVEPFADRLIPVLSIEDLLVCKVLFDRPKDWQDIDKVLQMRRGSLDSEYMDKWLGTFLALDDPRISRLSQHRKENG